jgi:hypothetical protein
MAMVASYYDKLDCHKTLPYDYFYENKVPYKVEVKCVGDQKVMFNKFKVRHFKFMTTKGRNTIFEDYEHIETCKRMPTGEWKCFKD